MKILGEKKTSHFFFRSKIYFGKTTKFVKNNCYKFPILHIFVSHQHVQMITAPHEKKRCGMFFWGSLLKKINIFKIYEWTSIFKIGT